MAKLWEVRTQSACKTILFIYNFAILCRMTVYPQGFAGAVQSNPTLRFGEVERDFWGTVGREAQPQPLAWCKLRRACEANFEDHTDIQTR